MAADPVDVVRAIYDAWNTGRSGRRWMHPDIHFSVPHADGTDLRGIEAVRAWQRSFVDTWARWEHRLDEVRPIDDERVLVLFTERVEGRATGVPIEDRGAAIFHVRDGKVVAYHAFLHAEEALRALDEPA